LTYAVRGKDKNKRNDCRPHPTFELLDNIIKESNAFPNDMSYTKGGILKIGKYQIAQNSNGYEQLKELRPGDNLPIVEYLARYNNTHFPIMDESDYQRRRNRKKVNRGHQVQWFERYTTRGISGVHLGMEKGVLTTCRVPPKN